MTLNKEHIAIMDHTVRRAAGGLYCGGGKEMDELVDAKLMDPAGRKSFVPDPYFRITSAGREALRSALAHRHTPIPSETKEVPFSWPVSRDENRAAHGNICRIERCACGAIRRTNINGQHAERGEWKGGEP